MKQQLLLLEDIEGLGRAGDLVSARPGFIRNFLLPQKKGVIADKHTLKMQAKLKEEREKRALVDRADSEELARKLEPLVLKTEVKVDPEGKMYGSVSALDVAKMMQDLGYKIEKKNVVLPQAIKNLGSHTIQLKLKEGVLAKVTLEIQVEGGTLQPNPAS